MTLRDYFAAKAMQAMITAAGTDQFFGNGIPDEKIAAWSYATSDAMLKERLK